MWTIKVRGVVQGVGFRPAVKRAASLLGARGFVRNDGSHVTICCDSDPDLVLSEIGKALGPLGRIDETEVHEGCWSSVGLPIEGPPDFRIIPSREGERDSSLPRDTAICDRCLKEMFDPRDRRHLYPFTNCTDCGARFTVVLKLPYDRERTTMCKYPPCPECSKEYSDEQERRFHAQTLSCPSDGPRYVFLDRGLSEMASGTGAFIECAKVISKGGIAVLKGWGGMHLVCDPGRLERFRDWYKRPFKPFALMVKDMAAARDIASVSQEEELLLRSPARPIVLLRKRKDPAGAPFMPTDLASPGLDSIGMYLPYSGIHYLLFWALEQIGSPLNSVVMTSANVPGDPMALELDDAKVLDAEGYLVHDRAIASRCDDSVVVPNPVPEDACISHRGPFGMRTFPIRKARGLVPDPLPVPHGKRVLGAGAERNVTITVTRGGKAFTSQYLGTSSRPLVMDYIEGTAERFQYLFGVDSLDAVAVDGHPMYRTGKWGRLLAEQRGVPSIDVQHHHAHAASLLVDSTLEGMGAVVVDGVGFGNDGSPWGGECLEASMDSCRRVGHLEPFGLPGGDASVYHPERIAHWLTLEGGGAFHLDDERLSSLLEMTRSRSVMTSSLGRLLDALSSLMLGVTWRTYDGEPAMRLEALLARSRAPILAPFEMEVRGGIVPVIHRWRALLDEIERRGVGDFRSGIQMDDGMKADLAMGFVSSVIDDLVEVAFEGGTRWPDSMGRPLIGLSGGVAYDLPVVKAFAEACNRRGAAPVLHSRVPPGDGGISLGQAAVAGRKL